MLKMFGAAAVLAVSLAMPACAEEMSTSTPELVLPEPETAPAILPHSSVSESEALALPEPETEAIAPVKRCGDRETVYLTN